MDASGVGLGVGLLQVRDHIKCPSDDMPDNAILSSTAFTTMSVSSAEIRCSNIEREVLGVQYGLEKFCHFSFARELSIIKDCESLVESPVHVHKQSLRLMLTYPIIIGLQQPQVSIRHALNSEHVLS